MKTIHHLIVPVTLSILATTAFADTAVVDGIEWTYEELDEEVCIGSDMGDSLAVPSSTAGAISVPSRLNGYPVTTIGDGAFSGCSGLTSITIPDSVTWIGSGAFHGCSSLLNPICNVSGSVLWFVPSSFHGSFSIPDGVTSIGNYAFEDCSGLTSVVIPNSVKNLSLYGCSGLETITIPASVTSIKDGAFSGCSGLETITIPDSVTSIGPWAFSGCSGLETITIPDSVTSIGAWAFSGCSGLTSISIPDSVTSIEEGAFEGCSGLTSIAIPDGVTDIRWATFSGCSGLTSVTIPDSVTSIKDGAFSGCSGLETITIPASVTSIEARAFDGCWSLSEVHISDLEAWCHINFDIDDGNGENSNPCNYSHRLFLNGEEVKTLVIPDDMTDIGLYAFSGCWGLSSVTANPKWGGRFSSATNFVFTIPDGVSRIDDFAFEFCRGLTSITIPDSVTWIGDEAFEGCSGLETITIPDSVTSIGVWAFDGCDRLEAIYLPFAYSGKTDWGQTIIRYVYVSFEASPGMLPEEIQTRFWATNEVYGASFDMPEPLPPLGYSFEGWILNGSIVGADSVIPVVTNHVLTAVWSPNEYAVTFDENGGDSVVPKKNVTFDTIYGVLPIPSRTGYAFASWMFCNAVVTEETVCTTPSNHVLRASWTPNDYTVSFDATGGTVNPSSKVVTFDAAYGELPTPSAEGYVFLGWQLDGAPVDASAIVQTPTDHTLAARWGFQIGNGTWEGTICNDAIILGVPELAPSGAVEIPAEIAGRPIVGITTEAFAGNAAITAISIPASVTNVAEGAFAGCTGLRRVAIQSFYGCERIADLFPELAESVEEVAFLDGITAIPDNFFEGCSALRTMDLAESVVEIGTNVFEACSVLETVVTNDVELYQGWALGMAGAAAAADLVVPDGVRGIAAGAFENEHGIGTVTLPETLRFVGARAFKDCTSLERIAVPEGVRKIDREAFRNCTYAQGLSLGEDLAEIGDGSFANCSSLMGATLPAGVKTVGENAFSNCWRMLSVSIPQSAERVGNGAFADCRKLAGVTVPLHVAPLADLFPAAYGQIETVAVAAMPDGADAAFVASRQMVPGLFAGCAALVGIELPAWVCNVADGAFEGCASISSLAFPDAVTNLGARACASMTALESVAFPASLVSVGDEAFDGDSGLVSLALPEGLRSIGARAFRGLSRLPRADLPGGVRSIGTAPFAGCRAIRAVSMPGDVETISSVFPAAYPDIVSATIVAETDADGAPVPQNAPTLRERLLDGCSSLTKVELPQNLAEIGSSAFGNCAALAELGIPSSVTNVGAAAFAGCVTLSSVALPKDLEVLQDGTFQGCESMAEIVVPESVQRLGNGIFDGCTLLRSVKYVGNAPAFSAAGGGPYAGLPAGAKSYVANGSKGWDGVATSMSLPEFWPDGTTYEIAFWEPNRFDAAFDPNHDAEEPLQVGQVTGTSYVLPAAPVRLGARFDGWWTERENGARITASTQVLATRPHALYAHWTMNRYHVHFDANGGTGTADPVEMTVGTPASLPACPFGKIGNSFAGWATEPGGAVVYADGAEVVDLAYANNGAVTLYAVWTMRDWTLADYLDAPGFAFETAGGGEWGPDWDEAKAGGVSLRCDGLPAAAEGGRAEAVLRATVTGAGTLAFWWKVSCEEADEAFDEWFDYASFAVDGAEKARIAGESGWRRVECAIEGPGAHELAWTFARDDYDEDGADWANALWVDGVEWTPAAVTLSFDAGGAAEGAAPAAVTKWEGYGLALPGPGTLADPPRSFAGWSDGERLWSAGETYVFGSGDAVLTAVWTLKTWTLAEAVDAPALVFATGGTTNWTVDAASGWTNGVSAKSGAVANGESSWIETEVSGAGTLNFRWKVAGGVYRNKPFAYAKAEVDGAEVAQTHLTDGWEGQTLEIAGAGAHTVRWTYQRTSARACDGDCASLDGVAWTPSGGGSVVAEGVEIPVAWLDGRAASFVAAADGDREAAARATAANGRPVWECYVADLDPDDPDDDLVATIEMVGGQANVSILKGEKTTRNYEVQGAPTPAGPWGERNSDSRFFRIRTTIPE